ncbi:hypothetical protein [Idiomarina abyssalis]|uniref:hypothetical protein n=1 Tax=Idiomarina abyssalis TaxID=86102 RepID=UPI003A9016BA
MDSIIIAAVTGVVSSVATIAAIKVDIGWIKQTQSDFKERLKLLENRLSVLEKNRVDSAS